MNARAAQAHVGVRREGIGELQRARILGATFDVAAERGAASVSVADVVSRSGVSRRTFYDYFENFEDCLFVAFERALSIACEDVLPAYGAARGWRGRIRAGLVALLVLCDREPNIARMLICESRVSGARVAQRRAQILARLTRIIDEGRTAVREGRAESVSPLVAEGIVGGVLAVIQTRLARNEHIQGEHTQRVSGGGGEPFVALVNGLMSMIVLPYCGLVGARRELERPVPIAASARRSGALLSDPFKDAGMRLTYRTVRVLVAVSECPRASNRPIGETAGITDQGQISKLLGRLQRLGLVTNTGANPGQGLPNSWALSEKGERMVQSVRTHTDGESQGLEGRGR